MSHGTLRLVCVKCTREGNFAGVDRTASIKGSIRAGWRKLAGKLVCPKCPGGASALRADTTGREAYRT